MQYAHVELVSAEITFSMHTHVELNMKDQTFAEKASQGVKLAQTASATAEFSLSNKSM